MKRDFNGVVFERATDSEIHRLTTFCDALIAHLYGLTETEFRHILTTFPLVDESVKAATLNEFLKLEARK